MLAIPILSLLGLLAGATASSGMEKRASSTCSPDLTSDPYNILSTSRKLITVLFGEPSVNQNRCLRPTDHSRGWKFVKAEAGKQVTLVCSPL